MSVQSAQTGEYAERLNAKIKTALSSKILLEKSMKNYVLTMNEIIAELEKYRISSGRKSL